MACPKECADDREHIRDDVKILFARSFPTWVRGVLFAILAALFTLYGGLWVYAGATYATKTEVRDLRGEMRDMRTEVGRKLDRILEALPRRSP